MAALVTRRNRATLPVGRAILAPEWRSLGLQSLTLFQTADVEVGPTPSGLTRSGTGFTPKAGASLGMGVSQAGGNNVWGVTAPGRIIGSGNQFAVVLAFQLNSTGQTSRYLAMEGASTTQTAIIYGYTANTVEFFAQGYSGADPRTGSGIVVNDTLPHVIVYSYDGAMWRGFLDGVEKFAVARTFSLAASQQFVGYIGGAAPSTGVVNATYFLHARFSSGLPRAAALRLSGSVSQLFKSAPRRLWMGASLSVTQQDFTAAPAAQASLGAALSTSIQIAAAPAALASMGASLATQIQLTAAPVAQAGMGASLTTGIRLSAAPAAQASVGASLSTAIQLAAAPAAQASLGASLSVTPQGFIAALAATASLGAVLTTGIRLAAAPAAQAGMGASLSTGAGFAAAPAAQASMGAVLSTQIQMAAAPAAVASLSATLSAPGRDFSASPAASASLGAVLTTGIRLSAAPAAQAGMGGALSTQILLAAAPGAQATLSAALSTSIQMSAAPAARASLTVLAPHTQIRLSAAPAAQPDLLALLSVGTGLSAAPAASPSLGAELTAYGAWALSFRAQPSMGADLTVFSLGRSYRDLVVTAGIRRRDVLASASRKTVVT